jgi:hypothetical protein
MGLVERLRQRAAALAQRVRQGVGNALNRLRGGGNTTARTAPRASRTASARTSGS